MHRREYYLSTVFSLPISRLYAVYIDRTSDSRPFYIGVGNQRRVNNPKRNELHRRIASKHGHVREVVLETDVLADALALEETLVDQHRTYAHGGEGWWGANLTRGGESSPMKDPHVAARVSATKMGHNTSEETRAKIGESVRRVQSRPDVRQKMSVASSRRRHSEETREKMRRSQRVRPKISEETRLKLHEAAVRRESQKRVQATAASAAGKEAARSMTSTSLL